MVFTIFIIIERDHRKSKKTSFFLKMKKKERHLSLGRYFFGKTLYVSDKEEQTHLEKKNNFTSISEINLICEFIFS